MQVFVPSASLVECVRVLDYRRLGKQRVECQQILAALSARRIHESGVGLPVGWMNHPCTRMWEGYETALGVYMTMAICEWQDRGYVNNMVPPYNPETFLLQPGWVGREGLEEDARDGELPWWWGDEEVHLSHQRALLSKDPEHYRQFGWRVVPRLDYEWRLGARPAEEESPI